MKPLTLKPLINFPLVQARTGNTVITMMATIYQALNIFICFPSGSEGKVSAYNAGDLGLTPGLGRSPGEATQSFCFLHPESKSLSKTQVIIETYVQHQEH